MLKKKDISRKLVQYCSKKDGDWKASHTLSHAVKQAMIVIECLAVDFGYPQLSSQRHV